MENKVKILMTEPVTWNVKRFIVEKPANYKFIPGQATEVSINDEKWRGKKNPFTFTSLNSDLVLEFIIKRYPEHKGVTDELHRLNSGDELIIRDVWGTINFKGKGIFIAGGAGITPFIAILRQLKKEEKINGNKLIFSNKTQRDIILEKEFKEMFPSEDLILTLTEEKKQGYENEKISVDFLKKHIKNFSQNFYICGPKEFVKDIRNILSELGAEVNSVVFER